jgi:hypothetical protein|tara:strand:+ start:99 stop:470 length:372 start_codon:yes stop_codon:yes gene_type:complete
MADSEDCTTCAICLNPVRETRHNKVIRCGHLFHSHCIENWKARGKQTCPVCRKIFDGTNFKVTVKIENMLNHSTFTTPVEEENYIFDTLDAFFDIEDTDDLESLLRDFGVSVSNLDPSILNTE